jgi:hypothetical protein
VVTFLPRGPELSPEGPKLSATIIGFDQRYWDRQDEKRFAFAEANGLDPDYELISLPFPDDPKVAHAVGVLSRRHPRAVPLDFRPFAGDVAVYLRRGWSARRVAQLTGLPGEIVEAFGEGYEGGG